MIKKLLNFRIGRLEAWTLTSETGTAWHLKHLLVIAYYKKGEIKLIIILVNPKTKRYCKEFVLYSGWYKVLLKQFKRNKPKRIDVTNNKIQFA